MKCPKCTGELERKRYRRMEVDRCAECGGMWLDSHELDQLEDIAFDVDELKGSFITSSSATEHKCPHCASHLTAFQYRYHSLQLEHCGNGHGYWLDQDEEKRVLELMEKREDDMERKMSAEAEWDKMLREGREPSFFEKLKDLFK